jgi:hypothetical protein
MQSAAGFTAPTAAIAGAATATPANMPTPLAPAPAAEPQKLVFSNEPTVAIPSDGNSLRFELPPPPEPEPIVAVAPPAPAAANEPTQVMAAPQSSGVVPAAYTALPANAQPTTNAAFNAPYESTSTGPWRSPQVVRQTAQPAYAPQIVGQPVVAAPVQGYSPAAAQPNIDVQLRAVASPDPVAPSTPRIRLPGYPAPQPTNGASAAAVMNGAGMQVVQIAPGPPQGYYDPALGTFVVTAPPVGSLLAPAATSGSSDGFRPRSSMR